MGYTNKQIDSPKIYCSICMHRHRATKTLTDRNEIVLHGYTKFPYLLNPVLITAGADYTS